MKKHYLLIFLLAVSPGFSQTFITLDEDTGEFVENVNYSLFKNNRIVSGGVTLSDKATTIAAIDFDSITFTRVDYKTAGFTKERLDSVVLLKKDIIYLDEAVITSNRNNQIVIGEKNRFIKRLSRPVSKELLYGAVFKNETNTGLSVNRMAIFVEKVKFKTSYKINFFKIEKTLPLYGKQGIKQKELIFSTDTLYLNIGAKGKVEIDLLQDYYLRLDDEVLVSVELIDYFDEAGKAVEPETKHLTRLKFQMSDKADYFAKLININTNEMTAYLNNINLMINYDFANQFYKKPHKSILVTPAIILYAVRED